MKEKEIREQSVGIFFMRAKTMENVRRGAYRWCIFVGTTWCFPSCTNKTEELTFEESIRCYKFSNATTDRIGSSMVLPVNGGEKKRVNTKGRYVLAAEQKIEIIWIHPEHNKGQYLEHKAYQERGERCVVACALLVELISSVEFVVSNNINRIRQGSKTKQPFIQSINQSINDSSNQFNFRSRRHKSVSSSFRLPSFLSRMISYFNAALQLIIISKRYLFTSIFLS